MDEPEGNDVPLRDEVSRDLQANTERVVRRWEDRIREEPWSRLPDDWRVDHLPAVIEGLAATALGMPADREAVRGRIEEIARHGSERSRQGLEEVHVLREYHYLRLAIADYMFERWGPEESALDALIRVDAAITMATRASLLGYHRSNLEEQGTWSDALDRLIEDSPLLIERDRRA